MEAVDPVTPQPSLPTPEPQTPPRSTTAEKAPDEANTKIEETHSIAPAVESQSPSAPSTPPQPAHSFSIWHLLQSLLRICLLVILLIV